MLYTPLARQVTGVARGVEVAWGVEATLGGTPTEVFWGGEIVKGGEATIGGAPTEVF